VKEYKININPSFSEIDMKRFVSLIAESFKNPVSLDDFYDLEHHEARYRVNMQFGNYHAAEMHIRKVIQFRIKNIISKHCG